MNAIQERSQKARLSDCPGCKAHLSNVDSDRVRRKRQRKHTVDGLGPQPPDPLF